MKKIGIMHCLTQWFPTGVLQRGVRGATKFGRTAFLLMFYYLKCCQIVIFNQLGVPPNFFKGMKGAANQKRLKNTGLTILNRSSLFEDYVLDYIFGFAIDCRQVKPLLPKNIFIRYKKYEVNMLSASSLKSLEPEFT